jgi:hypothetical protein
MLLYTSLLTLHLDLKEPIPQKMLTENIGKFRQVNSECTLTTTGEKLKHVLESN